MERAGRRSSFAVLMTKGALPGLLIAAAACRSDMAEWQQRLENPEVQRMAGVWSVGLLEDPSRLARGGGSTTGEIALTLNRERRSAPGVSAPPLLFGTYDVSFDSLGIAAGDFRGVPTVVASVRGDSVILEFAADSRLPVDLRGILTGDSVVGRWSTHRRAGVAAAGAFVLKRRR